MLSSHTTHFPLKTLSRHTRPAGLILTIPKANVYNFGDTNSASPVFHDLAWRVLEAQSWAVVSPGSGAKSNLFQVCCRLVTGMLDDDSVIIADSAWKV
jgi:hypothetical protein